MTKKQKLIIIGFFFFILVFVLIIKNHYTKEVSVENDDSPVSSIITCSLIEKKDILPLIDFSGRISATNKINIISEVNGISIINNSRFEIGEEFKKGDILLQIQDDDVDLELKSIKSQFLTLLIQVLPELKMDFPSLGRKMEIYVDDFDLNKKISNLPKPTNSKQRNFLSSKQVFSNYYKIKSLENKLEKFKIKAPFDGVITKALINTGSNIIIGQPLGEFINPNIFEITTSINRQDAKFIKTGDTVVISSFNSNIKGIVDRIGKHINQLTQSIDVSILVQNSELQDGMYISGQIIGDTIKNVAKIERQKINDKKEIYTIVDEKLKLKTVDIVLFQNDSVIIKDFFENDCLVDDYRNYFHNNMPIN